MDAPKKELVSIAMLLRQPRAFDEATAQKALDAAFHDAPGRAKVVPMKNVPGFGVLLGPMRLAILNVDRPYFSDVAKVADSQSDFSSRIAIQQHTAWLSIDLAGEVPASVSREKIYSLLGKVIGELLSDDVLGLVRRPHGPIVGYDFSFIPMFRNGRASEVFQRGVPDRIIKARDKGPVLAAASVEARQRWPEFVSAFADRKPGQGFAVKKKFVGSEGNEHMWVTVTDIEGATIRGWLSNTPGIVKSLKLRDPVEMAESEIEDWIYSHGKENVGGFQARILKEQ